MSNEIKVLKVFKVGKITGYSGDDCDHEWAYSSKSKAVMTMPINIVTNRICKHCGRVEFVQANFIPALTNYKAIYDKFYKESE